MLRRLSELPLLVLLMGITALAMLPDSERQELLETFNDYPASYERQLALHQRIAQLAEQYPDHVAATCAGAAAARGSELCVARGDAVDDGGARRP